ncbi:hypothetical protein RRG08_050464 [Elysia crispata]|uniref:RGS domain-containing protein n=1 Tax=Elysia crispata TaxID=231223 RepID=A0AAE0ZPM8_9GAST|nr:hypothetical protein RRG08_050464 [Elysia crispata]
MLKHKSAFLAHQTIAHALSNLKWCAHGKVCPPETFKQRITDTKVFQDGDLPQEGIGSETGYKERTGNDIIRGGNHFLKKCRGVERLAANRRVVLKTISEMVELKAPGDLDKGSAVPQKHADLSALLEVPVLNLTASSRGGRPQSVRSTSRFRGGPARRGARQKTTGRAQATREDKNEFLAALSQSAMGHLSITMLYFYKYLLKHGEEDGMPQIDKDLFFYKEVQKFKDGSHANSDDEMLKRKVQSIVDCFLDSVYSPTLQIDIPADMHQKTLKATQRYLTGKETTPFLFDDSQFHVFKELLFYWAGYRRASSTPEDPKKKPITKYEKMLQKRMENIQNYQAPSSDFTLPSIPEGAIPSFTISLSEGVKFKEVDESVSGTPLPEATPKAGHRGSKAAIPEVDGLAKRSRGQSRRNS